MPRRTLIADRGDVGHRLDLVVCRHLADLEVATRSRVQKWIRAGEVCVNGASARRTAAHVGLGDRITITLPEPKTRRVVTPEDLPLSILHEDDWLLAANKPAGVVVHPTYKHAHGTLLNAVLWRARAWPGGQRPTIVGRLDRLTSGIVVIAKTRQVHAALQRALAAGEKEYLAVVYGRVNVLRGTIELRLARAPGDRRRVVASPTRGVQSITRFERLATIAAPPVGLTLLRCHLVTGRMHQIRVHLAARGWPIVGDQVYAEPRWQQIADSATAGVLRDFPRQALHASRVTFVHPLTTERVAIVAPTPADMVRLIKQTKLLARSRCL